MALIKCPECGKEVSDRGSACPNCAFPIASLRTDGTVSIKISTGLSGYVYVYEVSTMKALWSGVAGEVARFYIAKPIEIGIKWGLGNNFIPGATACVEAGKKYELVFKRNLSGIYVCINELDETNSGI